MVFLKRFLLIHEGPHPDPLPEYRAREQERFRLLPVLRESRARK
jgi:hypothetical protein